MGAGRAVPARPAFEDEAVQAEAGVWGAAAPRGRECRRAAVERARWSHGTNPRRARVLQTLAAGGTQMVAQRSTGFNNIDLLVAERLAMTVARVSYYSPYSVAEFAWTLAMAVNRRVVRASTRTRDFDFRLDGLMGRDLHGRTVGVLGTGKIGEAFARIAHGFGMNLLGWDIAENPACVRLGMRYVPKDQLLAESDLISLHVPLIPETRHLIDAGALKAMKDDAILVNSSRGGLIDSAALVAELREGRFTGVGLDVYEAEAGLFFLDKSLQAIEDDTLARLITFPNVLVTSHQAYYTREAVGQIVEATLKNVLDYRAGRRSENVLVPRS
ncbi:MAG: 2-hydroxyacid dehydrogenase [Streptomyces sp.]|uniref:2-hydroxyacid dehydrogenase n=1 Tax=Glycomyces artemisiae TaxID=1076443 RepID=A0A850CGL7_9ACTN|nr:2-hydroxyacid dehydrogenase [Streptomyces sp.]NUQ91239.1 2-hydroxyacid dehydrogenase [Glycomyces artemisiae]